MFIKIDDRTIVNVEKVYSVSRLPNGRVVLSGMTEDIAYADTDGYADHVWEYFDSIALVPTPKQEAPRTKVVKDDVPF